MHMTTKQAAAIVQQVADEHGITDAFDLFDAPYLAHLVNRINERTYNTQAREDVFVTWVLDDLGVLDCWDSTQLRQQSMDAR